MKTAEEYVSYAEECVAMGAKEPSGSTEQVRLYAEGQIWATLAVAASAPVVPTYDGEVS